MPLILLLLLQVQNPNPTCKTTQTIQFELKNSATSLTLLKDNKGKKAGKA